MTRELKAFTQMRGGVNKSSLEYGSLEAVLIESTEVNAPEKGDKKMGPKV